MRPLGMVNIAKEIQYATDDLKQDRAAGLTLALQLAQHRRNLQDAEWQRGMQLHTLRRTEEALARELTLNEDKRNAVQLLAKQENVVIPDNVKKDYELSSWYLKYSLERREKEAVARLKADGKGTGSDPDFGDILGYWKELNDQRAKMGEGAAVYGNRAYLAQSSDPALLVDLNTTALTKEEQDATVSGLASERYFLTLNGSKETGQGVLSQWQQPFYQRRFPVVVLDDDDQEVGGANLQQRWDDVEAELQNIPAQLEAARKAGDPVLVEYLQSEQVYLANWKIAMARRNAYYLVATKIPDSYKLAAAPAGAPPQNLGVKPRPRAGGKTLPSMEEAADVLDEDAPARERFARVWSPTGNQLWDRANSQMRVQVAVAALRKAKTPAQREAAVQDLSGEELNQAIALYEAQ